MLIPTNCALKRKTLLYSNNTTDIIYTIYHFHLYKNSHTVLIAHYQVYFSSSYSKVLCNTCVSLLFIPVTNYIFSSISFMFTYISVSLHQNTYTKIKIHSIYSRNLITTTKYHTLIYQKYTPFPLHKQPQAVLYRHIFVLILSISQCHYMC